LPAHLLDKEFVFYFILAVIFSFFTSIKAGRSIQDAFYHRNYALPGTLTMTLLAGTLLLLSLASITSSGVNPFIYFRF
jgi:alginate O-acetyltransferase complex protein AlgI